VLLDLGSVTKLGAFLSIRHIYIYIIMSKKD